MTVVTLFENRLKSWSQISLDCWNHHQRSTLRENKKPPVVLDTRFNTHILLANEYSDQCWEKTKVHTTDTKERYRCDHVFWVSVFIQLINSKTLTTNQNPFNGSHSSVQAILLLVWTWLNSNEILWLLIDNCEPTGTEATNVSDSHYEMLNNTNIHAWVQSSSIPQYILYMKPVIFTVYFMLKLL